MRIPNVILISTSFTLLQCADDNSQEAQPTNTGGSAAAGQSGHGGNGNVSQGGSGGSVNTGATAGTAGNQGGSAGSSASAGNGGTGGTAAMAGNGGISGIGGTGAVGSSGGSAGNGNTAGTSGNSGNSGTAGSGGSTGGTAGSAGMAGNSGNAGSSGISGTAGSGGQSCSDCPNGYSLHTSGRCVRTDDPLFGCGSFDGKSCGFFDKTIWGCNAGSCIISACAPGWEDCDNDTSNGCETNLLDPTSCGACNSICNVGQKCSSSGCVASCAIGFTDCGTFCANLLDDPRACGDCDTQCTSSKAATCSNGTCLEPCPTGHAFCASMPGFCQINGDMCCADYPPFGARANLDCSTDCPTNAKACTSPTADWLSQSTSCWDILNSRTHCGECNTPCAGHCVNGQCVDASANLVATMPTTLQAIPSGSGTITKLFVQDASTLYWVGTNGIYSVPKSGGVPELVISVGAPIGGLIVANNSLYYSSFLGAAIQRVDLQNHTETPLAAANKPSQILADSSFVYWADEGSSSIKKMALDGSGSPSTVTPYPSISGNPYINFAINSTHLFYAPQYTIGDITRVNLDGSGGAVSIYPSHHTVVLADDDGIYYTYGGSSPGGRLYEVSLSNLSDQRQLQEVGFLPSSYALTPQALYFVTLPVIEKLDRCTLTSSILDASAQAIVADDLALYTVQNNEIRRYGHLAQSQLV